MNGKVGRSSQTLRCKSYSKVKTRKLSRLSKSEQNRLAKLEEMLDVLILRKNVKSRRLAIWLTKDEYESFESGWHSWRGYLNNF